MCQRFGYEDLSPFSFNICNDNFYNKQNLGHKLCKLTAYLTTKTATYDGFKEVMKDSKYNKLLINPEHSM